MSRDEPTGGDGPSVADRDRYAAALKAAADPELTFGPIHSSLKRLEAAVCAGELAAGALAARDLELHSLQLCVAPAVSAVAADNRRRVAVIIAGWAWPRRPALAASLELNTKQEARRWGGPVAGEA